jgi:hypothetical protein
MEGTRIIKDKSGTKLTFPIAMYKIERHEPFANDASVVSTGN